MNKNENIEIKRIMNIIKRKVIIIAFILIVSILLGYMYSYKYVIPEYKSTSTLLLIPNESSENKTITTSDLTLNSELISTYSNIAKQSRVIKQVINNLGLDITEKELLEKIEVNVVKDTYIIKIAVKNTDAQMAADITREISNIFLKEIKDIYNLNNIGIVDEAQVANDPYNINHIKDIAKFFIIGLVVSAACIMCIYVFDNTIKTQEDLEEYVKLKVLGRIPRSVSKKSEIINKENAKSYVVECINTIRTNILYMSSVKSAKTILITSCTSQEGKSFVSANIAVSFAETNKKVLLIDADMRKGRANKIFNISNSEGLSNYLYDMTENTRQNIELGTKYIKETQIPNLHILTRGTIPPNPSELLDSSNMKELLKIAKNIYDVIIIDAPPCKLVTDSTILSTIVDSTILVASSENTKINDLEDVKKSIEIVGGKIIGSILNNVKIKSSVYKKSYYYGDSKKDNKCEIKEKEIISVNTLIEQSINRLDDNEKELLIKENEEVTNIPNVLEMYDNEIKLREMTNMMQNNNELVSKINAQVKELKNEFQKELEDRDKVNKELLELNKVQNKDIEELIESTITQIMTQLEEDKMERETESKENEEKIAELVSKKLEESIMENETRSKENEDKIAELVSEKLEEFKLENNINEVTSEIQKINNGMKDIIKEEIMNINYIEQISQINEAIENLKDSYLELSNLVKTNNVDAEAINNKNIIDINILKQQRQIKRKKRIYSIEEEIPYSELEESAFCVIPINTKKSESFSTEDYGNVVAVK